MEAKIMNAINNPEMLEGLYRSDKKAFVRAFRNIYPEISGNATAGYLPVYAIWAFLVAFGFPLIFGI